MFIEIIKSNDSHMALNLDNIERISEMGDRTVITTIHSDSSRQNQYVIDSSYEIVLDRIRLHTKTEKIFER